LGVEEGANGVFDTGAAVAAYTEGFHDVFDALIFTGTDGFLELAFGDAFADTDVHGYPLLDPVYVCSASRTSV